VLKAQATCREGDRSCFHFLCTPWGFEHYVNGRSAQQKRGTVQIQKNSFSHTDEQGGEGGVTFFLHLSRIHDN
jgi:hypothetical protein